MRTTIYGKESLSGKTLHIDEVQKDLNLKFICGQCGNALIPVKTPAKGKDWHFRHPDKSNIVKCRQTGLHDYVQQLLLDKSTITIAKGRTIEYSDRKKEQWLEKLFRSDVFGIHDNLPVHFEIVVTNDLSDEKLNYFVSKKIRCVRIGLSDKRYLNMPHDIIADIVLNEWDNKSLHGWEETTLEESVIIQTSILVPGISNKKEIVAYNSSYSREDILITIMKLIGILFIVYKINMFFFGNKSSYVTVKRTPKNRYRRY